LPVFFVRLEVVLKASQFLVFVETPRTVEDRSVTVLGDAGFAVE
jgi:hypothetical protein